MYRSLVIVAEIIILVILLRSTFVQYLFSDVQLTLTNWLVEISQIPERAELNALKETVAPNFEAMRPFQKEYLDGVMSNKASLNHFYALYCMKGDKNPYIYGASLHYFCNAIQNTQLLTVKKGR